MTTTPKAMQIDPERVPNKYRRRELRPIQLLRYVYLVDLAHAETCDGRIYTGIPSRSHHLGPWASEAWQPTPALAPPAIRHRSSQDRYRDELSRWRCEGPEQAEKPEPILPTCPPEPECRLDRKNIFGGELSMNAGSH
ncbi:MAG: hypothetical protein GY856_29790 [bacterium]|nr:hypothetical protein [bacterium]